MEKVFEDTFKTISESSEEIFRDKGSKFIAIAIPVQSEGQCKEIISEYKKKYHDARHHCFAYKIGLQKYVYRINDDGEPSGTAGRPIYGQILSFNLTNILVIVIRYFGGTLLGTSGLINAYKLATETCLLNADIIEKIVYKEVFIGFSYLQMNAIMKIVKENRLSISEQNFNSDCWVKILIRENNLPNIVERFSQIEGVKFNFL